MKLHKFAYLLLMTAALTACGGGSDAPTTTNPSPGPLDTVDVVDKYVGTWVNCQESGLMTPVGSTFPPSTRSWIKETDVFTKTSPTTLSDQFTQTSHTVSSCADTPISTFTGNGVLTFVGTKLVDGVIADKLIIKLITAGAIDEKNILFISGNLLKIGDDAKPNDAEGYPTAFDPVYVYTKQP